MKSKLILVRIPIDLLKHIDGVCNFLNSSIVVPREKHWTRSNAIVEAIANDKDTWDRCATGHWGDEL